MSSNNQSSNQPRYNLSCNPPYQINYRSKRSGKHITVTKRRVTFQFGFSSASAIATGKTGPECRGEEHEVVLIWSHITGKRQLFMDGREVHMSKVAGGNTKFQFSWSIPGNHILKIAANAVSPMGEQARLHPEIRQFDLFLDGRSFFNFAKIYELGSNDARDEEHSGAVEVERIAYRGISYHEQDDVEEEVPPPVSSVQTARVPSTDEVRPPVSSVHIVPVPLPVVDLLEEPASSYDLLETELPYSYTNFESLPSFGSTTCTSQSTFDEFSPRDVEVFEYSQKSFKAISNEILYAYNNGNTVQHTNVMQVSAPPSPSDNSLALTTSNAPSVYSSDVNRTVMPSMYCSSAIQSENECVDEVTKCMRNLVNLEDINSKPFQPASSNTNSMKKSSCSQGLPPKSATMSWDLAGRAPTLAEIQSSMKPTNSTQKPKEIMRTYQQQMPMHHQAMMASGSMVSYNYYGGNSAHGGYARAY